MTLWQDLQWHGSEKHSIFALEQTPGVGIKKFCPWWKKVGAKKLDRERKEDNKGRKIGTKTESIEKEGKKGGKGEMRK